ncbi:MAG: sigma 54-interacting transcriptional regulator [bacterium]
MNLYNLSETYITSGEITSSGIYMLRSALKKLYEAYGVETEGDIPEVSISCLLDHLEDHLHKQGKTPKVIRENKYWIRRLIKFGIKAGLLSVHDDQISLLPQFSPEVKTCSSSDSEALLHQDKRENDPVVSSIVRSGDDPQLRKEDDSHSRESGTPLPDAGFENVKIFKTPRTTKLLLILIGIVVLGMLVIADMIHRQFESYVFQQFQQHQLVIAQSVANGIREFMMETEHELNYLTQSRSIQLMDTRCQAELNRIYQINHNYIRSLKLIDSLGLVRFGVTEGGKVVERDTPSGLEKYLPSFQKWSDKAHTVLISSSSPRNKLLLVFVPITIICPMIKDLPEVADKQAQVRFLVAEIDVFKTAKTYLQHVNSGARKYGLLIDQDGNILYHPDDKYIGKKFLAEVSSSSYPPQYRQKFLEKIKKGAEGFSEESPPYDLRQLGNDQLKLFAYSPLRIHEQLWSVVVAAPYQEIHPINRVHRNIALLVIGLFCLVSLGSFIIFNVNKKRIKVEEEVKYLEKKLVMEDQIRKSEERLRAILESIGSDRISILDKDLHIIWANPVALQRYGEDIIGRKCYQVYKGSDHPCSSCPVQKTFSDGKIYSGEEFSIADKDGTSVLYLTSTSPIRDRNGKITSVVETSKDITERMRLQEAIKSSRDLLDAILNNMNDGIRVIDTKYNILFMNQNLIDLFGNQISKKCYRVFMGGDAPCNPCALDKIFQENQVPVNFIKEDKQKRLIEISASPLSIEEGSRSIIEVVRDITERKRLESQLIESEQRRIRELKERYRFGNIIGKNHKMQEIYELIQVVAQNMTTVLLLGESGTGKELIARAVHYNSPQHDKPFVEVCCSVLSENLLESELFGHVKGAFTGAIRDKIGRFEMADGGTIFLDEVGDISLSIQVKLLRVIQEREFVPVGGENIKKINVRIVAATNKDLKKAVENKEFREDLYYRLNVITIHIPPLRERMEDLPMLVNHFIEKFREKTNKPIQSISNQALDLMFAYSWPGNVRELENAIEHAFVKCEGTIIGLENLPLEIIHQQKNREYPVRPVDTPPIDQQQGIKQDLSLNDVKKDILLKVLKDTDWDTDESARILKISRATFYRWLKKYNISRNPVS